MRSSLKRSMLVLPIMMIISCSLLCVLWYYFNFVNWCVFAATPDMESLQATVQVDQNMVYFGIEQGDFYTLESKNGQERWQSTLKERFVVSNSLIVGIMPTQDGERLIALRQDGHQVWEYIDPLPGEGHFILGELLTAGDMVYVIIGERDGSTVRERIQALRVSDGASIWSRDLQTEHARLLGVDEQALYLYGMGELLEQDGREHDIIALAAGDGRTLWGSRIEAYSYDSEKIYTDLTQQKIGAENIRALQIVFDATQKRIYFKNEREIYALELQTGKRLWTQKNDEGWAVIVSDGLGGLYSFHHSGITLYQARDGHKQWSTTFTLDMPDVNNPIYVSLGYGQLYLGQPSGKLTAFAMGAGEQLWQREMRVTEPMVVTDKFVYVAQYAAIQALKVQDGALLWQAEEKGVYMPKVVVDGILYTIKSQVRTYCDGAQSQAPVLYAVQALATGNGEVLWNMEKQAVVSLIK